MMMKKISVVIPCYNAAEYLDRCMEHILNQTIGLENIEIILVDDASTDRGATLDLMMGYEKKYPDNIMVIPLQQNLRQGGARNVGMIYAGGEYLMFCDADDWLMPDAMEILYQIALKYDADVVEFQFKEVMAAQEIRMDKMPEPDTYAEDGEIGESIKDKIKCDVRELDKDDKGKEFMILCTDDCGLGCWNKLYRMQLIKDNHIRFAEHLICEEPSFTLPVRVYERKHVLIDAKLYCYFQSPGSTVRSNWDDKKFDNLKVWLNIIQDFKERGLFEKYHDELEYMFYGWGYRMSLRMLVARGYILSMKELDLFRNTLLQLFPDALRNTYVIENTDEWDILIRVPLDVELTEEKLSELNGMMRHYLQENTIL